VYQIANLLALFLNVITFAIFFRALASWFPIDREGAVLRALDAITEPVLEPLRRVVPTIGMIDITPMVAMILLQVIAQALTSRAALG
jgi:YggT family protein